MLEMLQFELALVIDSGDNTQNDKNQVHRENTPSWVYAYLG